MKNPIYVLPRPDPLGANAAIDLYSSCGGGCTYCDSARHLRAVALPGEAAAPRKGIVEAVHRQLIELRRLEVADGFVRRLNVLITRWYDPYPPYSDTETTRKVISLIKAHGHAVTIVTKNPETRDFDLLDKRDTYCVSLASGRGELEPNCLPPAERLSRLFDAQEVSGCQTAVQVVIIDAAFALRCAEMPVDKIVFIEPRRQPSRGIIIRDKYIARSRGRACFA